MARIVTIHLENNPYQYEKQIKIILLCWVTFKKNVLVICKRHTKRPDYNVRTKKKRVHTIWNSTDEAMEIIVNTFLKFLPAFTLLWLEAMYINKPSAVAVFQLWNFFLPIYI